MPARDGFAMRHESAPAVDQVFGSIGPIIVTSLATLVGLAPLAANLVTGGEAYAAMALAILGGLALSFVLTIFLVPAVYYAVYSKLAVPASPPSGGSDLLIGAYGQRNGTAHGTVGL